jgi:CRISPR type I-D-associated protein Csc3/Cas10d
MTDTTTDRIEEVVEAFGLVATYDASTHEIQDPVRTLINTILEAPNDTRSEIITQAAGQIYRRFERRSDSDNRSVYFLTDEGQGVEERVRNGCAVFYDRVYQEMLGGDPIRLAKRRAALLDGVYLLVAERRRDNGGEDQTNELTPN